MGGSELLVSWRGERMVSTSTTAVTRSSIARIRTTFSGATMLVSICMAQLSCTTFPPKKTPTAQTPCSGRTTSNRSLQASTCSSRTASCSRLPASRMANAMSISAHSRPIGIDGNQCGLRWTEGPVNDGTWVGVGEQMCALEVVQSNLIDLVEGPLTNTTGGTSIGDPNAGSQSNDNPNQFDTIKTGDKAGASILTLLVLSGLFAGAWWMGVKG